MSERPSAGARHFVSQLNSLAPGERLVSRVGTSSIIVDCLGDGELTAWWNRCPHQGSEMLPLGKAGVGEIRCRFHRWRFDVDGSCIDVGVPGAWSSGVNANLSRARLFVEADEVWVANEEAFDR